MFALSDYILIEPFSLINSIILSLGIYGFGSFLIRNFLNSFVKNSFLENNHFFINYLVSYNFMIATFYFVSIFSNLINYYFILISIILYFFSFQVIIQSSSDINLKFKVLRNNYNKYKTIYFLLFGFFLISLGPITNADSIDYHIGVAIKTLLNEKFTTEITWNTSTNASSGELFNAFSLFSGSEQLASISNFFAFLSIAFVILSFAKKYNKNNVLIALLLLSSPAMISLVPTSKPQLMFIANNFLVFSLLMEKKINFKGLPFLLFLIANSFVAKFSFIFSSSLLFIIICLNFYKNYKEIIYVSIIIFILIIYPHYHYKFIYYDINFFDFLRYPVPVNIEGYEGFYNHLKGGGPVSFPYNIFHPLKISYYNEGLGIFFIIFLLYIKKIIKYDFKIFVLIFLFFSPYFFMQNTMSRYFLELMLFLGLIMILSNNKFKFNNFLKSVIYFQFITTLTIVLLNGVIFFYGSMTNENKKKLQVNLANEFSIFEWSNNNLPKNSVLLSIPRSIAFSKVETYSLDFLRFIEKNKNFFWAEIKKKEPNFILSHKPLKKNSCIGDLKFYRKNIGFFTSRNIFQKKKNYDGYIYEFNYHNLPNCYLE